MENEHFQRALGRLEAVVERLERIPVAADPTQEGPRLAALEARHRTLREGAAQALARLDRLIEGRAGELG